MIIKFKTHFPWNDDQGNPMPTDFVAKIGEALKPSKTSLVAPKWHTIRRINNKRARFRPGMKLQMATGSRFKPDVFAETVCTTWQHLKLHVEHGNHGVILCVRVCHPATVPHLLQYPKLSHLSMNDGFATTDLFHRWFLLDVLQNGPGDFELVGWGNTEY